MYAFFDQYVKNGQRPDGGHLLHYYTLNEGRWHTTTRWPLPGTRTRTLYLAAGHTLAGGGPGRHGPARAEPEGRRPGRSIAGTPTSPARQSSTPTGAAVDRDLLSYTGQPLRQATRVSGLGRVTLDVTGDPGAAGGALYAYLEDVQPSGRVTYVTEGELALANRATIPGRDNPAWRKLRTPRTYTRADASPFPLGQPQQVTFDLLPTSVLFRPGDRIQITIAAADPSSFQLLPADGDATYTISHGGLRALLRGAARRRKQMSPRSGRDDAGGGGQLDGGGRSGALAVPPGAAVDRAPAAQPSAAARGRSSPVEEPGDQAGVEAVARAGGVGRDDGRQGDLVPRGSFDAQRPALAQLDDQPGPGSGELRGGLGQGERAAERGAPRPR